MVNILKSLIFKISAHTKKKIPNGESWITHDVIFIIMANRLWKKLARVLVSSPS